jgi:uncharacterized protein
MSRVIIEDQRPELSIDPGRADVACFVGLVRCLPGAVIPDSIVQWLSSLGYPSGYIENIVHVPIPFETYAGFASLFDTGGSAFSSGTDYVATAVRNFFAQGGKRCYVVRAGDPVGSDSAAIKSAKLQMLLPDDTFPPEDRRSWTGIGSLSAISDVSFLAAPDLPILLASAAGTVGQIPTVPPGPEQFVECSQRDITVPQLRVYASPAPRLTSADYDNWAQVVAQILNYLASGSIRHELHLREVQFVAAFPLPRELDPAAATNPSSATLAKDIQAVIAQQLPEVPEPYGGIPQGNISSAFLQLSYPWLKTTGSYVLLEGLEPPDGALVGILARNALTRGTFTSATKIVPAEIFDVWPPLPAKETTIPSTEPLWDNKTPKPLITRLSLFGFTPSGLRLLSDVTAYPRESYRPACVNRLVAVICRAARHLGENVIFDNNGPALWGRVQTFLQQLLTHLWLLNALDGVLDMKPGASDGAFSVRCDRSTMTQNDIDNGRLVAEVTFRAASTIDLIHVTLAFGTSGVSTQDIANSLVEVV